MFFFISLQAVRLISGQYCRLPTAQEPIKMLQFTDGPFCHMIMCTIYMCHGKPGKLWNIISGKFGFSRGKSWKIRILITEHFSPLISPQISPNIKTMNCILKYTLSGFFARKFSEYINGSFFDGIQKISGIYIRYSVLISCQDSRTWNFSWKLIMGSRESLIKFDKITNPANGPL